MDAVTQIMVTLHIAWIVCFFRSLCGSRWVRIAAAVVVGYLLQLWGWVNW